MSPVINVKHISKNYREIKALDDLSFSVPPGKIYGFLGQNGAGKSTAIRILLTLIEPSSGEVEIFGMDLKKYRMQILRKIGAIVERPDLYKFLTAKENLRIFAAMSAIRISEKQIMDQLEQVGLAERANGKVKTYSQGMKQRLGIAVALINDPELIILDEPMNGLDPQGIADVRNLILHLSREMGKTVFVSSHLLGEMELIADYMLIIDKGKKVVEGPVSDLFDPAETMVDLETTNADETYERLRQTHLKDLVFNKRDNHILFRLHRNKVPAVIKELVQMDVQIMSLYSRHSLEDLFLSLTTENQHVETFKN
ncbi:MAG TPA: ABC transporter ATP-binding protein [Chitinophagaceae bacterium]|nr:ABC transporter ATP-binding protein [Chitinophagaceae bacterium]